MKEYIPPNEDPFVLGPITISNAFMDSVDSKRRTISIFGLRMLWPFPIVKLHGSAAVVFGYPVFGGPNTPKFIRTAYRFFDRIQRRKLWFLYRYSAKHQYHVVRTDLAPGYHDEDERMLHACMKLLGDYIEWHGGPEDLQEFTDELMTDPDPNAPLGATDPQINTQSEAVAIWRWWTTVRPTDQAQYNAYMDHLYGGEKLEFVDAENGLKQLVRRKRSESDLLLRDKMWALERKISDDEQAMLHRLISIRRGLWT